MLHFGQSIVLTIQPAGGSYALVCVLMQNPQLNDKGEAGVPSRASRNTLVLDAARELLPHARVRPGRGV